MNKQFDELRTLLDAHNVPDDAFRLLSEIETEYNESEEMLKEAQSDAKDFEDKVEDLKRDNQSLEDYIHSLEEAEELELGEAQQKLLAVFADHHNWDGNTFTPQDRTFSIWSPDEMADKVLRGVKITT